MFASAAVAGLIQVHGIIVETGGALLGPPGHETPKGQGGGPKMERAQNRLSAGSSPPYAWCGSGREVTLSLMRRKNNRIAHRVSVDQPCCRAAQKKIGGSFLCAVFLVSAVNTARGLAPSPTTPPGMNIDDACTEKGMRSVTYSSTAHRSYTDEHTTQLYQISFQKGGRTGLGVVVHATVYVYASMEYSVVWYSGLQR